LEPLSWNNPVPYPFLATNDIYLDSVAFKGCLDHSITKKDKGPDYSRIEVPNFHYANYKKKAQFYLNRRLFSGTPITGEIMANCAVKTYLKYKILVPLPLVLAQGQFESKMGTKGRSPKNNPFNVGEYDHKTVLKFKSTEDGVQAYFNLIASRYLKSKSVKQLMRSFTNDKSNRYASDPNYERKIRRQMRFIKRYFYFKRKPVKHSFFDAIAMN